MIILYEPHGLDVFTEQPGWDLINMFVLDLTGKIQPKFVDDERVLKQHGHRIVFMDPNTREERCDRTVAELDRATHGQVTDCLVALVLATDEDEMLFRLKYM